MGISGPRSSIGQSGGLRSQRLEVRILSGIFVHILHFRSVRFTLNGRLKVSRIWKVVIICGLFFSLLPSVITLFFLAKPAWFNSVVYSGSAYSFITIAILGAICFFIGKVTKSNFIHIVLFCIAIPVILVPATMLNGAVLFGRDSAKFNSWHLLRFFIIIFQVHYAIVFGAVASAISLTVFIINQSIEQHRAAKNTYRCFER